MGVHGLTTYLRERKRLLSSTTVLSTSSKNTVPIVVDGWSFIYDLYNTQHLPWVYGGEYAEFGRLVKTVVESWIKVGLQVSFVFDGACPDLKFPTVISRLAQSHIQPAQLFFRTSTVSRSTGRFLNETRILPPLAYSTCIHALEAVRSETGAVDLYFADEEGDPYAVELAARLGGYVLGNDSDFVVFNSAGYRGYIPLDELVWQAPIHREHSAVDGVDDDDFHTVTKPKAKKKPTNTAHLQYIEGLLPPENGDRKDLSISFMSYSPNTLANHLDIPVSLLPLLGALVGNDFSKETESNSRKIQGLFFERSLTLTQRIEKVASTIRSVMSPGNQRRKPKDQVGSVMDLIDRTVNALLSRLTASMGSGEIEAIVDKIVNATLQYAIPKYTGEVEGKEGLWATSVCALHDPEACSMLPMISRNVMRQTETSEKANPCLLEAREKYLDAYRSGLLSPKMMDLLNTGTSWARLFLENPDLETVGRSIGRPIREWIHAILHDAVGLEPSELDENTDSEGEGDYVAESDDDELVDVVESDSDESDSPSGRDFLAPLKGALQRLHDEPSDSEATEPPASVISHQRLPTGPPSVIEYLRRGTRIASETVAVTPIQDLLTSISLPEYADDTAPPLILRSEEDRLSIFLRIVKSDVQAVRSLPSKAVLPVVALRWVVHTLHARWEEGGSKEREKERWTKSEAHCFLSSLTWAPKLTLLCDKPTAAVPPIEDRNVQLMAQMLMALDTIEQLSQVLLLSGRVPSNFHQVSGRTFHALLTGTATTELGLPNGIWEAAQLELKGAFQEERAKNTKKPKRTQKAQAPIVPAKMAKLGGQKNSIFALLGDMDT